MSMLVQLDAAALLPPAEAVQACARVQQTAEEIEFAGIALKARAQRARYLLRGGDGQAAAAELRVTLEQYAGVRPADMYLPELWQITCEIYDASGESQAATETLAQAARWIRDVAAHGVREEFRDSFLNRNPINRLLLAAATRRGIGHAPR